MATKTANVTARVLPEVKREAESILSQLGIPVSVLIDSLYRQIIMNRGIPYPLSVPTVDVRDRMTDSQFDEMMQESLRQAKAGEGMSAGEAFKSLRESI